jgi:hypothetical protein
MNVKHVQSKELLRYDKWKDSNKKSLKLLYFLIFGYCLLTVALVTWILAFPNMPHYQSGASIFDLLFFLFLRGMLIVVQILFSIMFYAILILRKYTNEMRFKRLYLGKDNIIILIEEFLSELEISYHLSSDKELIPGKRLPFSFHIVDEVIILNGSELRIVIENVRKDDLGSFVNVHIGPDNRKNRYRIQAMMAKIDSSSLSEIR